MVSPAALKKVSPTNDLKNAGISGIGFLHNINHIIMKTILFILPILVFTACHNTQAQQKINYKNVDSATFRELAESGKGIILDVRAPEELEEGFITNSINYNYYEDDFETRLNSLDKTKEIYVYCAGGGRSSDAANMLIKKGFTKVYNLEDGFDDWKKRGLPVSKPKH